MISLNPVLFDDSVDNEQNGRNYQSQKESYRKACPSKLRYSANYGASN
jgi:hypothetical protein